MVHVFIVCYYEPLVYCTGLEKKACLCLMALNSVYLLLLTHEATKYLEN